MANPSPFLQYQDKNGDFLIDECEIKLPGPIEKVCLDCVPNPKALVEDWKTNLGYPFLNEKICMYQVGVQTNFGSTGDENTGDNSSLTEKFEFHKEDAIELYLDEYEKATSFENIETLRNEIVYDVTKDFELQARNGSKLSLLYSVPFSVIENLEDATEDEEDESEPVEVTYLASEMPILLTRVNKGLNLYSRYARADNVMNGSSLLYTEDRKPFRIEKYGSSGFGKPSRLSLAYNELDRWLNTKGFNLYGFSGRGTGGIGNDRVLKITLGFSRERKIRKIKVFSLGCREKPKVFKGRKLSGLNRRDIFKDKTAMNYLSRLAEMESDLTSRKPKNFVDFIQEHTFPEVSFFNNQQLAQDENSCVREAIIDNIQGIGEAFIDEVLGIGDIIAYQFHQHACKNDEEETELMKEFGEIYETVGAPIDETTPKKTKKDGTQKKTGVLSKGSRKTMKTMAMQQALEKLQTNPNVFVQLCGSFLAGRTGLSSTLKARDIWDFSFNQIKLCGLLDFLLDALGCLWGGLELEEALRIALTSALQAMGLTDFGVLFVGLPAEEQAELDALVKRKLSESRQKANTVQTAAQDAERDSVDVPEPRRDESGFFGGTFGEIDFVRPFEDPELLEKEQAERTAGPYEGTTVTSGMYEAQGNNFGTRPRIGTTYNNAQEISGRQTPSENAIKSLENRAQQTFNPDQIMEAYILALVEYYSGRLLDLVDRLNEFPGAEIISKILATFDCPRPPLFTPSVMDFLKDIELPFCRNIGDIALPKFFLPPIDFADLWRRITEAIKEAIIQLVIQILFKLIVKICEVIGDAICKALETTGKIAGNLPGLIAGNTTMRDIVRESICGPGASESQVDDALAAMFATMGGAGSNLANKDRVLALNEAIASTSTRQEIIDASLGNPSSDFLTAAETVIQSEFPDFLSAFPNRDSIADFFSNVGNLIPPDVKNALEDLANGTYENLDLPANPTLCATPEQIEEFCSIRSQILEGRASDAQIAQLCSNTLPADDFEALNNVLQDGIGSTIMQNMPPLLSDPGCSNGLFDREPEVLIEQASDSLSKDLDNLKVAYSYDMLGNGIGKRNWGYMNMVLSDTLGRPFTNHMRNVNRFKLFGGQRYVDFYVENNDNGGDNDDGRRYAKEENQKGAFPAYIGEWMVDYWNNSSDKLEVNKPNNELKSKKTFRVESDYDITKLYDYGYNYKYEPTEDGYKITRRVRKSQPDITMKFRDNRQGNGDQSGDDENMTIGYNFNFFFSEVLGGQNTQDNNVRVMITQRTNQKNFESDFKKSLEKQFEAGPPEDEDSEKSNKVTSDKIYEFVGSDGGVDELLEQIGSQFVSTYPRFESSLQELGDESPLIVLMSEILDISNSAAKNYWQSTTQKIIESLSTKLFNYETNKSFMYGAKPNLLDTEDADYGVVQNGNFVLYSDAEVNGESLTNNDSVLGISRDQHKNGDKARIYYLDPNQFGGSYTNPKVYIKPVDTEGMLGLVNVMFPELSPCKPQKTDLVDFGDIASMISNSYTNYPDDPRLSGDPDCVVEKPFDRILSRSAKSGIEGTIAAACRIFASVHFLRTINTFSIFKPDFKNNMSTMYASFILEEMEKELKDSQGGFAEFFNPFKDDEFWYAFLEQSVQTYFQMVQAGKITEVPTDIERALERIGEAQNKYKYPDRDKLRKAKKLNEVGIFATLTGYREDQNLAAVKSVEEDCKLILKEFMVQEVNFLSDVFYKNMISEGFIDKDTYIYNIMYYILSAESGLTNGSSLEMTGEIREEVEDIPTGTEQYTDGNMLALEDGTPYVGYYHTMEAPEDGYLDPAIKAGDLLFMVGEEHGDDERLLRPFANKVKVNIGNVDGTESAGDKPFYIRKYIKVDNVKTYDSGISGIIDELKGLGDALVSEKYPGTLEYIYDAGTPDSIQNRVNKVIEEAEAQGRQPTEEELSAARTGEGRPVVGLKGELGIRYGLEFRASTGGLIANSEIDVLDLPLSMIKPLEGGSKELLCLINKLIDDPKFKLFMDYALPIRKMTSALAIYNDVVYLQSIGQIATGNKDKDAASKPGIQVDVSGNPTRTNPGWFPQDERPGGLFVLTWDEWNRRALDKSVTVLKKMFKSYYYSRDFGKQDRPDPTAAQVAIQNLKEKFKFAPGDRSVPWWHRRSSNPFDANGKLCETPED